MTRTVIHEAEDLSEDTARTPLTIEMNSQNPSRSQDGTRHGDMDDRVSAYCLYRSLRPIPRKFQRMCQRTRRPSTIHRADLPCIFVGDITLNLYLDNYHPKLLLQASSSGQQGNNTWLSRLPAVPAGVSQLSTGFASLTNRTVQVLSHNRKVWMRLCL